MKPIGNRLAAAGHAPEEDEQICAALNSLPKEYETVVTVLESIDSITLSAVCSKLLLAESKLKNSSEGAIGKVEGGEPALGAREARECFYCKKKGRIKRHCRKYRKDKNNGKIKKEESYADHCQIAFVSAQNAPFAKKRLIIDSGASSHMARNKKWLLSLKKDNNIDTARMGDGRKIKVAGIGDIAARVSVDNNMTVILLKDALCAPKLSASLISLSKTTSSGLKVSFQEDLCAITKHDGSPVARAVKIGNLCSLVGRVADDPANAESAFCINESNISLWHYRHGHLNSKDLQKLSSGMALGMKLSSDAEEGKMRKPCVLGKGHRAPFNKERSSNAEKVLELVHSDLCGPITPKSIGGGVYMLTLTDDYSRASWVRFLAKKSDATQNIKEWMQHVEKQSGEPVKSLRSDRGGEYINKALKTYFDNRGVHHEKTTAYTPLQNGVAERPNRTLFDKARSMLAHSSISNKRLWAEAAAAANYLRNRSPTRALKECTPYEKFTNKKPNVSHLKIFGSKAFVHAHKAQRKGKLADRAEEGAMVGHAHDSKAYRIFDIKKSIIKVTRDVVFDETEVLNVEEGDIENASENLQQEEDPGLDLAADDEQPDREQNQVEGADVSISEGPEGAQEEMQEVIQEQEQEQGAVRRYPERASRQTRLYAPVESGVETGDQTAAISYTEPSTLNEALKGPDADLWKFAIDDEMKSLLENGTWELCDLPEGRKPIAAKWVFKLKKNENGEVVRHKARLVAKGCTQRQGIDYDEVFSPVTRFSMLRALLGIAAAQDLEILQVDIKTALLNGTLEEEVYMDQPEGHVEDPNKVCRLKRTIYGLKQAPRAWFICLSKHLSALGFMQGNADSGLCWKDSSSGSIYVIMCVDDLLIFGADRKAIDEVANSLKESFDTRDLGKVKYFLGIQITRDRKKPIDKDCARAAYPGSIEEAQYGGLSSKQGLYAGEHKFIEVTEP